MAQTAAEAETSRSRWFGRPDRRRSGARAPQRSRRRCALAGRACIAHCDWSRGGSAYRFGFSTVGRGSGIGFRLARTL